MGRSSLDFWLGSIVNFVCSLFSQPIPQGLPRVARSPFFEVSAHGYKPGGVGVLLGFLGGVCYLVLQIRFQTEKCNFPHPISDENYKIHTHFQTWTLGRNYVIIT